MEATWGLIVVLVAPIGLVASLVIVALRRSFVWLVLLGFAVAAAAVGLLYQDDGIPPTREDVIVVAIASFGGMLLGGAPAVYLRWIVRTLRRAEERAAST